MQSPKVHCSVAVFGRLGKVRWFLAVSALVRRLRSRKAKGSGPSPKRIRQRDLRLERIDPARGFIKAQANCIVLGLIGLFGEAFQPGPGHWRGKLLGD
jgi:hypothetical protein